jgi:antitoxin (DNA-binding transcriptional repressor) of toxin-antitoxin stability system
MGNHSVAEAKNKLSELIDRALKGEGVVITATARLSPSYDRFPPRPVA